MIKRFISSGPFSSTKGPQLSPNLQWISIPQSKQQTIYLQSSTHYFQQHRCPSQSISSHKRQCDNLISSSFFHSQTVELTTVECGHQRTKSPATSVSVVLRVFILCHHGTTSPHKAGIGVSNPKPTHLAKFRKRGNSGRRDGWIACLWTDGFVPSVEGNF